MNRKDDIFGPYMDDLEMCKLLKISQKTLNNKICQKREQLPKYTKIPGSRRRLWLISDVSEWLGRRGLINHE